MSQKDIDKIIREYLSGKPTPEGEALFNAWYASHDDEASPLKSMSADEKEKIRQEIFAKVRAAHPAQPEKIRKLPKLFGEKFPRHWQRIAAIWIGLLMISLGYFVFRAQPRSLITVQTAYGEVKTLTLPDGSGVTLNANSQLRYVAAWDEVVYREVWLEGEAFFSVKHTSDDQKFQVHASHLNVEVLGTEFNVNNRRGDTEVVLHTGSVKLGLPHLAATPEVVMQPGELVAYSAADRRITKKKVDTAYYSNWRNQELLLNNTSLAEIARVLEDYYGLKVTMPEELKGIQLTATAKLSLKQTDVILKAISEIYGIEVKQDGNSIIFKNP